VTALPPSVASPVGPARGAGPRPQLWRISDRTTFADLRRRGRRARNGLLTVTWLPPEPAAPSAPPRAAFAVSKGAGAVARNRVRRRLRAALRELQRAEALPAGAYLVGAAPEVADLPWSDLVVALTDAVASATAPPS
jgi:ribonuclease P protein component